VTASNSTMSRHRERGNVVEFPNDMHYAFVLVKAVKIFIFDYERAVPRLRSVRLPELTS
jgi:hypothetical protein